MAKYSEEQKIYKHIQGKFSKATKEYRLFEDGDKILVALSGGKDSLTLLQLLAERSRIHKPAISIIAGHVSMINIPYKASEEYLQKFCDELQVPFHHIESSFEAENKAKRSPCFLCSWTRRKALFELAHSFLFFHMHQPSSFFTRNPVGMGRIPIKVMHWFT